MSLFQANPPQIGEHHVRLPEQLAQILNAAPVHAAGITGRGVRIAVIDSGFYPHPFYLTRGFKIHHIPTFKERNPEVDEYGHGTAQLASLFSLAPNAEVLAIKCLDRDPSYALKKAIELKPQILMCAWGFNIDHPGIKKLPAEYLKMRKLILKAIDQGTVVMAAAGNGQNAFPGSMPEVISVGGVFYTQQGHFEASDLSSEFESTLYPKRMVPDLCGLVGNRPHGRLLLVPVPPTARLAKRPSFATIAAGTATQTRAKGWAMFSGTSASTAMVAGAAALLLEKMPTLTPLQIKTLLINTGRTLHSNGSKVLDVQAAMDALNSWDVV